MNLNFFLFSVEDKWTGKGHFRTFKTFEMKNTSTNVFSISFTSCHFQKRKKKQLNCHELKWSRKTQWTENNWKTLFERKFKVITKGQTHNTTLPYSHSAFSLVEKFLKTDFPVKLFRLIRNWPTNIHTSSLYLNLMRGCGFKELFSAVGILLNDCSQRPAVLAVHHQCPNFHFLSNCEYESMQYPM